MKLNVQVWVFINTSMYETFVVTRNTLGIKQANGENNKMFFTSNLQKLGKTLLGFCSFLFVCFQLQFDTTNEKYCFSQTVIFLESSLTANP